MREFLDLYEKEASFRAQVALDLEDGEVWFNLKEFGKKHDIEGSKVLAIFTGDRRQTVEVRLKTNENPEGITQSRGILFVRAEEIEGVRADQSLRLDGRLYTVADARILQGVVWRIVLEANEP